jgi:hypothetical protein
VGVVARVGEAGLAGLVLGVVVLVEEAGWAGLAVKVGWVVVVGGGRVGAVLGLVL